MSYIYYSSWYKPNGSRRERKRAKDKERLHNKYVEARGECSECGGRMKYCESCQMFSRNCCVNYGTCQCS